MDDELEKIERAYRRKVILYSVLCGPGMFWCVIKVVTVHLKIIG